MNRITGFTFKASKKKHYKWPFFNERVCGFKRLCNKKVSIEELHNILENAHEYFLDEFGLSANIDGSPVNETKAVFKLAQLDEKIEDGNEYILAWMYKHEDGKFKNLEFGTRHDFDKVIARKRHKMFAQQESREMESVMNN